MLQEHKYSIAIKNTTKQSAEDINNGINATTKKEVMAREYILPTGSMLPLLYHGYYSRRRLKPTIVSFKK